MKKDKKVLLVDSIVERLEKKRKKVLNKDNRKILCLKYIPIFIMLFFFPMNFIVKLLLIAGYWCIITMFFDHRDITTFSPTIRIWFGVPGSGKTSVAAWLTRNTLKNFYPVLSNVEIKGAYKLEEDDLGKYDMSFDGTGAHIIYDEATINGMDGRQFKSFINSTKPLYFSIHRHMNNRVDVFSQGYDIDKRIRDRASSSGLFYLKRIPLKGFVMYRKIKKVLFIKKDDKQMIDGFSFVGLPRICYTKPVWSSFDTLDMSMCPKEQKRWEMWNVSEEM